MRIHLKPLRDQVLVITGASSGIGLCTARMAAERGVKGLVLVARSDEALQQLEHELNTSGRTRAVAVACDVADEACLRKAAEMAQQTFGGFDTWVNNAGVSVYGRILEISEEDHRRVFETNFWGVLHGSRVAIPHLQQRGGALINVGSTLSDRSIPMQGMYAATKHAVKAFTDALRMELEEAGAPVSITLVKPASIDTPYTTNAKNYMQDAPKNPPPVYAPDLVAETILYAAEHPVRDLFVGSAGKAFQMGEYFAPRATDRMMENVTMRQMHSGKPRRRRNALYSPSEDLRERGDYDGMVRESSLYTTTMIHPGTSLLSMLGVGAAIAIGTFLMKREVEQKHTRNLPMQPRHASSSLGGGAASATGSLQDQARSDTYAM